MRAWKFWAALAGCALLLTACGGQKGGGDECTPKGGSQAVAGAKAVKLLPDPNTVGKFDPKEIPVKVGDSITWDWQDSSAQHTVTADDGSFDSCLQGQGSKFTVTFTKAGKVGYKCTIHAAMIGTVNVT